MSLRYTGRTKKYCPFQRRTEYKLNGVFHRLDGPAIEYDSGTKFWMKNGLRHRDDGPAEEYNGGNRIWYQNGLIHRIDGPAIITPRGKKEWYQNGSLHRENGPAIEYENGSTEWYQYGQRHRLDGPAIEMVANNSFAWYRLGVLHRDDGPAIIQIKCSMWYQSGGLHRLYYPAIECIDDLSKNSWWKNGYPWSKGKSIYWSTEITIIFAPLQLPAYIIQWILEWFCPSIKILNQVSLINLLQNIRNSYLRIKSGRSLEEER